MIQTQLIMRAAPALHTFGIYQETQQERYQQWNKEMLTSLLFCDLHGKGFVQKPNPVPNKIF